MIKRLLCILTIISLALALFGCGGGGSSSLEVPVGVNAGVVSRVQLMATSYVNQTGTYVFFKAKVIDGNGVPMKNHEVIFTNLSLIGVLDRTTAVTGTNGIATVTLKSTTPGFATVQAEVNAGTEKIRDRTTVYFSSFDIEFPIGASSAPTLTLTTNNPVLFEAANDNTAVITATVRDSSGNPVLNSLVTFGADSAEATFPLSEDPTKAEIHTNSLGEAAALVSVDPASLRPTDTTLNITASADNNTSNVLTLFLKPITVGTVTVSAASSSIGSGGTVAISAAVTTTTGMPVPDNTSVNFTVSGGGAVTPFGQTADGVATATYTAPTVTSNTSATIRASVGSVTGSTTVSVTASPAALTITPSSSTICEIDTSCAAGLVTKTFVIGGVSSVTCSVTSTNTALIANPATPTVLGPDKQFTAVSVQADVIPVGPANVAVDLLVNCTGYSTKIVTVTVTNQ